MVEAAERVRRAADQPGSVAFERLFSRVDEGTELDDPLVVLSRQSMIDEIATSVAESAHRRSISDEEAEGWLKVLGMDLAIRAADLGLRTEADREALGDDEEAALAVVHALQLLIVEALDAVPGGSSETNQA